VERDMRSTNIIFKSTLRKLELHLFALNTLADEEPINKIDDNEELLSMINHHFEQLNALKELFDDAILNFHHIEDELTEVMKHENQQN